MTIDSATITFAFKAITFFIIAMGILNVIFISAPILYSRLTGNELPDKLYNIMKITNKIIRILPMLFILLIAAFMIYGCFMISTQ